MAFVNEVRRRGIATLVSIDDMGSDGNGILIVRAGSMVL
jgi:hypothetical protein